MIKISKTNLNTKTKQIKYKKVKFFKLNVLIPRMHKLFIILYTFLFFIYLLNCISNVIIIIILYCFNDKILKCKNIQI